MKASVINCKKLLLIVFVVMSFNYTYAIIRYVKPVPSGTGSGLSWVNASSDLQLMINNCVSGDEIWVAQGTYFPIRKANSVNIISPGNKNNAFVLKSGVKLYGGFVGNEITLAARNYTANITSLSGETGTPALTDNFFHVVVSAANNSNTILDGFTIKNGYSNGNNSIVVNAQTIINKSGAGIYVSASLARILNCTFSNNNAVLNGAGLYDTLASALQLTNCKFLSNTAQHNGGGFYCVNASPVLTSSTFTQNAATTNGGALYANNSYVTINSGSYSGNVATGNGGAIYFGNGSSGSISSQKISGNTALKGAGFYSSYSTAELFHCSINSNNGNAVYAVNSPGLVFDDCAVKSNVSGSGAGFYLVECVSPVIKNCSILGNQAVTDGGGIFTYHASIKLTNCLIAGNAGVRGAGIYSTESANIISNCTITGNKGSSFGAAFTNLYVVNPALCTTNIYNSILWGNESGIISGQIYGPATTTNVSYSIVQNGYPGFANSIEDPLFVSPVAASMAPTTSGKYWFQSNTSPAYNRGLNLFIPTGITTDLNSNPRVVADTVDRGAFELQLVSRMHIPYTINTIKESKNITVCINRYIMYALAYSENWIKFISPSKTINRQCSQSKRVLILCASPGCFMT